MDGSVNFNKCKIFNNQDGYDGAIEEAKDLKIWKANVVKKTSERDLLRPTFRTVLNF